MTNIKLKHIDRFRDRHGKRRYYFRCGQGPRVPLPGRPGEPSFMQAYYAAMNGLPIETPSKSRGAEGTFDRLLKDYFSSPDFLSLNAASTQRAYRRVME